MPEEGYTPLYKPPLRRHRLVPAGDAEVPPDLPDASAAGQGFTLGSTFPDAAPPASLLAVQAKLAQDAARLVEEIMPRLEALQTALVAQGVAEKTVETLTLVGSALRLLPDELASGAAASVERVDWIFLRLLNAPGQPGLIEVVLLALMEPQAASAPDPRVVSPAEQAMLRGLHRDLVTLQQGWEHLLELVLPPEMFEPASPLLVPSAEDAPPTMSDEAPVSMTPAPLPEGLVVASARAGWRASAFPLPSRAAARSPLPAALGIAVIVLVLALTGGGLYLMQHLRGQPVTSSNAAVIAPVPSPTGPSTSQPAVAPTATATPPTATSTPTPLPSATSTPAPTATPTTPAGPLCASDSHLCSSVSTLRVPCTGSAGVTFQVSNTGNQRFDWMAVSSTINDVFLVSINPATGKLMPGRQVTVTVTAQVTGQGLTGTLTITTDIGQNLPVVITLLVC